MSLTEHLKEIFFKKLSATLLPELSSKLHTDLASTLLPVKQRPFVPDPDVFILPEDDPFLPYSTCSAKDFFHPKFKRIWDALHIGQQYFLHRKYWEWVYIANALSPYARNPDARGLGFAVGSTETLAAYFASLGAHITASDAPPEIGIAAGWQNGGQFAIGFDSLPYKGIISRERMRALVEYRSIDMNSIPDDLNGYDFCWSSCSFEHLGTINKGLEFVINSVEKTLKPGGVACHTTEFNLSSNDNTVESGPTVLYRRRDLEHLIRTLRERGHIVHDIVVAPDSLAMDGYVDAPPYGPPLHMKLAILGHVSTSVAIIIERGGARH